MMLISILIFILTLLTLVVIHEFGHFIMAKLFKVKVEEFGFGIPPRIFGKKIGETVYSLNALPLGGFVKLLGEDESGKGRSPADFREKTIAQRMIIVVAGVVMNLILAWLIFYSVLIYQNFRIVYPTLEPAVFIQYLQKDFPAQEAGIKIGDRLLKIDEKAVTNLEDARALIQQKKGTPLSLTLANIDGQNSRVVSLTPKQVAPNSYLIGVGFSPLAIKQYSTFTEKVFSGITYSFNLTKVTFAGLFKLMGDLGAGHFQVASQSVSGPVGLASMSNEILSGGSKVLPFYLWFVGVISLTLAIFNVLPIPALDGGRLFFLIIEGIRGKRINEDIEKLVHQVGFAILLSLALLITYSDISKLLH